jgi:hypothetical protein
VPSRRCLDCQQLYDRELTGTWRCPADQAKADARASQRRARATTGRPTTTARGYGTIHQRRAKQLVAQAAATGAPCGICGQPCLPGQQLVAHHPDGKPSRADQATCRLVPAHKACNDGYRPGH